MLSSSICCYFCILEHKDNRFDKNFPINLHIFIELVYSENIQLGIRWYIWFLFRKIKTLWVIVVLVKYQSNLNMSPVLILKTSTKICLYKFIWFIKIRGMVNFVDIE